MRLATRLSLCSLLLLLSACASTGGGGVVMDRARFEAAVRARGVNPSEVVYPFATTPAMERFAREAAGGAVAPLPRLAALQRALFDTRSFHFEHDARSC